jgi:hypothetical protein
MTGPVFLNLLHKLDIGWPNIMLMSELRFLDRDGRLWTVPEGFVCDLASVPWFGRWLVPRAGRHNRAAVLHDWLFYLRARGELQLTRNQADGLMMQAMRADGVRPTRRALIRSALFAGSWWPWHFGGESEQALRR